MKRTKALWMGLTVMTGVALAGASLVSIAAENTLTEDAAEEEMQAGAVTEGDEEEENYDTGDASLDDPRNQDEIGEKELLVVSFGTSFNDSRRLTIGAIEASIEEALKETDPDYSIRRGFTSQIIIDHVEERDGEIIDNVSQALDRAIENGVKTLVVQPTHLMNGFEYNDLVFELAQYADAFDKVSIGEPLLTSDEDFQAVAEAIVEATKEYDDGNTAICFMGHGTEADSNSVYEQMQKVLADMGAENYYIGTVEATPSLQDVLEEVQAKDYSRVVLEPLMVVAGDHANNDMAGDEEDSWKSVFEAAGYEVVPILRGLGELEAIRDLYIAHAQAAVSLAEKVAGADEMTDVAEVEEEGMTPVTGAMLRDGTYPVEMESSSSMFKIDHATLTVEDGQMEAALYMSSQAYLYMYNGEAAKAALADPEEYILLTDTENGETLPAFVLPVKALDQGLPYAAYSKKKEKWYDRTLLFRADSLPVEAFAESPWVSAEQMGLEDGMYLVDVVLEGGSGRASVESPAQLQIRDGKCIAKIIWSSPNYDYMIVGEERFDPVNTEGNSAFEIPVQGFDYAQPVQADTTAMSQPYLIDYTLRFDSETVMPADKE